MARKHINTFLLPTVPKSELRPLIQEKTRYRKMPTRVNVLEKPIRTEGAEREAVVHIELLASGQPFSRIIGGLASQYRISIGLANSPRVRCTSHAIHTENVLDSRPANKHAITVQ